MRSKLEAEASKSRLEVVRMYGKSEYSYLRIFSICTKGHLSSHQDCK